MLFIENTCKRSRSDVLKPLKDKDSDEMKGSVELTGQLGDVMKESVKIAHTFAQNFLSDMANIKNNLKINDNYQPSCLEGARFLRSAPIHIHVPDGAVPKVILLLCVLFYMTLGWTFCGNYYDNCLD